jgi:uncharacterized protein Smg (DUF494 family)
MAEKFTWYDTAEYLKTDADMAAYLDACLEEAGDDPAFIAHALGIMRALTACRNWHATPDQQGKTCTKRFQPMAIPNSARF